MKWIGLQATYRLNWARRTSWGWWDDWDDTVLQTQDSKFEHWRSEAEHATSRSRRLPTILTTNWVNVSKIPKLCTYVLIKKTHHCGCIMYVLWMYHVWMHFTLPIDKRNWYAMHRCWIYNFYKRFLLYNYTSCSCHYYEINTTKHYFSQYFRLTFCLTKRLSVVP